MTTLSGETPMTMQFSVMSTLEAKIFAKSPDPEAELRELFASLDVARYRAHMRIAGIYSHMGRQKLERVRTHFAFALVEAELERLRVEENPDNYGHGGPGLEEQFADICGIFCYFLGEACEIIGRPQEASVHFETGVKYYNERCSMKLSLYEKQAGRLDRAQFLLTSATEKASIDLQYLLGDLFNAKGDHRRALKFFDLAASEGHERAATRRDASELALDGSADSVLSEDIDLGHGWTANINHFECGITVAYDNRTVDDLTGQSILTFDPYQDIGQVDVFYPLTEHQLLVNDLKLRSTVMTDDRRSIFLQVRASELHGAGTVAMVAYHESGNLEEHWFDDLPSAFHGLGLTG